MTTPALRFDGIVKRFSRRTVVDNVSLAIEHGEVTALAGVNGSGKSTLFRIAAGFVERDAGKVLLDGVDVNHLSPWTRVRMGIGYISQDRRCLRNLTGADNVRIALQATGDWKGSAHLYESLEHLQIGNLIARPMREFGPGETILLLLAKEYIRGRRVLLLDEPFAQLGGREVQHCAAIIKAMAQRGTAVMVSDHRASELLDLASCVHIIEDGALVFSGTVAETRYFRRA